MLITALACTLAALVALYALFLIVAHAVHDAAAFPGAGHLGETPVPTNFTHEDLQIPVGNDAGTAHAWWIPAATQPCPTLLFFHGNGYPLEETADLEAPTLAQANANLLLMDYRGYGTSSHLKPSGTSTAEDARAAIRYLTEQRGIPLADIWICGRSIGTAVAVRLAAEFPTCAGLILISPITNTVDVKPFGTVLRPLRWLGLAEAFDSRTRISRLRVPLLIITGTEDTIATPAMAAELHRRALGPKQLELVEGAEHNTIWAVAGPRIPALIAETIGR